MDNPFKGIDIFGAYGGTSACKKMALIMASILLFEVAGFTFWFPYKTILHIGGIAISFLYLISSGIRFNGLVLIFLVICGFNAFFMPIPEVFQSKTRYLMFLLVMSVCSPLIQTPTAITFRRYVYKYFMLGLSVLVVGSFFCFFAGVNLMAYNFRFNGEISDTLLNDYETLGGAFSGLLGHSMMLGPMAALVALMFLVAYIEKRNNKILILFIIGVVTTILSASRAALLSLAVAIFFLAFFTKDASLVRNKFVLIGCAGAICIIPFADRLFAGIMYKQEMNAKAHMVHSREDKFDARLAEFSEEPLTGVGYASVDPAYDVYNPVTGQIEPGTSHLAVLAQVGILGFIPYCLILLNALKLAMGDQSRQALFILASLVMFIVHMCFEGYVFGAGGVLCCIFWIVIALAFDIRFKPE